MLYVYEIVKVLQDDRIIAKAEHLKKVFKQIFMKWDNMPEEEFVEKWNRSEGLISELIRIGKPKFTQMVKASTTYNGQEDYRVYVFNTTEILHNREFVTALLDLGAVWNTNFELKQRRAELHESKNGSGKDIFAVTLRMANENEFERGLLDIYLKDDETVKYSYITDLCWKNLEPIYHAGSRQFATTITTFWAIVY